MGAPHLSFEISFSAFAPFLDHWASRYSDPERDKKFYDPHIGRADLRTDLEALKALFLWKNGGERIAEQKSHSICTNYFNIWIEDDALESRYLDPNGGGGAIWNIFYLHCRRPKRYPIYDQHTYRAMLYIQNREISEIPTSKMPTNESRRFIYASYTQQYRPFVSTIDRDLRTIDRALHTFGRFLKRVKPFVPNSA